MPITLIPNMTVAENLLLARPHRQAVIRWQRQHQSLPRRLRERFDEMRMMSYASGEASLG
jgi:hypothetical protein